MTTKPKEEQPPVEGHRVPHYDQDGKLIALHFIPEPPVCLPDCPGCKPKMRLVGPRRRKRGAGR